MRRDVYRCFAELAAKEREGIDYQIRSHRRASSVAVLAPHGGKIEAGTSEIAEAIAGEVFSFYAFEGIRRSHNAQLRLDLSGFDEPEYLTGFAGARFQIFITGNSDLTAEYAVFHGGGEFRTHLRDAIQAAGFTVRDGGEAVHAILELSHALREQLKEGTSDLDEFANAVRALREFDRPRSTQ